jgi:TolB-like protein
MLSVMLLSTLAMAEPSAKAPPKVLVLDLQSDEATESTARLLRDEVAVELSRGGRMEVLSSEDLRRAISVEAEKEAMGCESDASCLAELGEAMGARFIVHGSVGALGSTTIVHINLFDTQQSRAVARETAESRVLDDLLPEVRAALGRVKVQMLGDDPSAPAPSPGEGMSPLTLTGGVALGLGAAAMVVGAVMMGVAWGDYSNVTPPSEGGPSPEKRLAAQGTGSVGTFVVIGGAVVAAAGAGVFALGGTE